MNLADIMYGPWAVTPEMYGTILDIYGRYVRGEKADFEAIEANIGRKLENERKPYSVVDGVAVLPLIGVMAKRGNMFMRISGGVSTQIFAQEFTQALNDPEVSALVINADTPGGAVDGTPDLAEVIYKARGTKPILAWSDGTIASAGIWVASAADKVYISSDVVVTGSIGVVTQHTDYSKRQKKDGVKTTEITAGKYKRVASAYSPLSNEGMATIQGQLDYIYSGFVDSVAKHRGMDVEDVLSRAADGRIFIGRQGIEAGLVDGIKSFNEVMQEARELASASKKNTRFVRAKTGAITVNKQELEEKYPDIVGQIRVETEQQVLAGLTPDAVRNSAPAVASELVETGAKRELNRIAGIRDLVGGPGAQAYSDLVASMELDGKSTASDVAVKIVKEDNQLLAGARQQQVKDANPPVDGAGEPPIETKQIKQADFNAMSPGQKKEIVAGIRAGQVELI
jgi:signal peptide peptidase SppA